MSGHLPGEFAYHVALAEDEVLVSDLGDNSQGADTGAVYVHDAITDNS